MDKKKKRAKMLAERAKRKARYEADDSFVHIIPGTNQKIIASKEFGEGFMEALERMNKQMDEAFEKGMMERLDAALAKAASNG